MGAPSVFKSAMAKTPLTAFREKVLDPTIDYFAVSKDGRKDVRSARC